MLTFLKICDKRMKKFHQLPSIFCLAVLATLSLPATVRSDSTSELIANYQCGDLQIEVWKNKTSGELTYRSTSYMGNLSLTGGIQQNTEGVRIYKFPHENYNYWLWQGTLDNPKAGTLEIYENDRRYKQITCTAS